MNMLYSVNQLALRSKYISIYFCFLQIKLRRLREQFSQSQRLIQQQIRMAKEDNMCTTGWKQHRNTPGDLNCRSEPDEAVTTWSKNKECSFTTFNPRINASVECWLRVLMCSERKEMSIKKLKSFFFLFYNLEALNQNLTLCCNSYVDTRW